MSTTRLPNARPTVTTATLIRWAGASALLAGTCYVLVGIFHPPNIAASADMRRRYRSWSSWL